MFLNKYVNYFYVDLIYEYYNNDYIDSLDENNFGSIYLLFKKYNFNYIGNVVLKYLKIFEMEFYDVFEKLEQLKIKYGNGFVNIIFND